MPQRRQFQHRHEELAPRNAALGPQRGMGTMLSATGPGNTASGILEGRRNDAHDDMLRHQQQLFGNMESVQAESQRLEDIMRHRDHVYSTPASHEYMAAVGACPAFLWEGAAYGSTADEALRRYLKE